MNKEKVNKLIDSIDSGLNDIEEDQQPVMQALTEYVRADVEDLKEELNSKPVMPAIFDSWYKEQYDRNFNIPNKIIENYAKIFYGDIEGNDDLSHKLMLWVAEYTYDGLSDTLCRQWREKLLKGVDAIINGYEVED